MDDKMSLKSIFDIIDLCKYSKVDGEETEIIVSPTSTNGREITIGIRGNLYDRYTFEFDDGLRFDEYFLPRLLDHFIKEDDIETWSINDPNTENTTVKSLLKTKDGNEFLIQSYDKSNNYLVNLRDKINELHQNDLDEDKENDLEYTELEKMCGITLKYLCGRIVKKDYLEDFEERLGRDKLDLAINIVYDIYKENNNKHLDNNVLVSKIKEKMNDNNREVCIYLLQDLSVPSNFLIDDIRKFIQNEEKYKKYIDNEMFKKCKEVGIKLANHGYFKYNLSFPRGAKILELSRDGIEELTLNNDKNRYALLLKEKNNYKETPNKEKEEVVDAYINYLLKTRKKQEFKKNPKEEINSDFIVRDNTEVLKLNELLERIDLYKGAKRDDEDLSIEIKDNKVFIGLTSGLSRDSDVLELDSKYNIKDVVDYLLSSKDIVSKEEKDNEFVIDAGNKTVIHVSSSLMPINNEMGLKIADIIKDKVEDTKQKIVDSLKKVEEIKHNNSDVINEKVQKKDDITLELEEKEKELMDFDKYKEGIINYYKNLSVLKNENTTESEKEKSIFNIFSISSSNPYVYYLHNLYMLYKDGKISKEYYESKEKEYKDKLDNSLKEKQPIENNPVKVDVEDITKILDDEEKKLPDFSEFKERFAAYHRKLSIINSGNISEENEKKFEEEFANIASSNPYVKYFEKLRKFLSDGKITREYYESKIKKYLDYIKEDDKKKSAVDELRKIAESKGKIKESVPPAFNPKYGIEVVSGRVSEERIDERLNRIINEKPEKSEIVYEARKLDKDIINDVRQSRKNASEEKELHDKKIENVIEILKTQKLLNKVIQKLKEEKVSDLDDEARKWYERLVQSYNEKEQKIQEQLGKMDKDILKKAKEKLEESISIQDDEKKDKEEVVSKEKKDTDSVISEEELANSTSNGDNTESNPIQKEEKEKEDFLDILKKSLAYDLNNIGDNRNNDKDDQDTIASEIDRIKKKQRLL